MTEKEKFLGSLFHYFSAFIRIFLVTFWGGFRPYFWLILSIFRPFFVDFCGAFFGIFFALFLVAFLPIFARFFTRFER